MNESTFRSLFHNAIGEFEMPAHVRNQARSALEPPAAAPAQRLARNGESDRYRPLGRRTELAAVIATLVLAAMVIGSFAYIRAAIHPQTVGPPITPLILFSAPASPYQIDGMTWDGRISGQVTRVPENGSGVDSSNPAGTLFVDFPKVLDRSGRVVAQLTGGPYANSGVGDYFVGTWADDETHYCQSVPVFAPGPLGANSVPATLQLTTPGGTPRNVAQVGEVSSEYNNVKVVACSVLADRAVVVESDPNGRGSPVDVYQYWVVQLSTGKVLWTHDLSSLVPVVGPPGKAIVRVVSSRDGRYVAEVGSSGTSAIYGPDGTLVGQVANLVLAFSWDGSLVVAGHTESEVFNNCPRSSISSCVPFPQPQVIRWRDGTIIWTVPAGHTFAAFQPEPGGASFAIAAYDAVPPVLGAQFSSYPTVLYVVSSTGQLLGQTDVGGVFPSCFCQP